MSLSYLKIYLDVLYQFYVQSFPPPPPLTESTLPSQGGKVFLVTGGTSGVGFELARILYFTGGRVYITARSIAKAEKAIDEIKASQPTPGSSPGELHYLILELSDLATIKATVEAFQAREPKLDVLWNNAGVAMPASGATSAQGHSLDIGVNLLGPYLLTHLLLPSLRAAAETAPPGSVRIVWAASLLVEMAAPPGGVSMKQLNPATRTATGDTMYALTKAGNWLLAAEFGRRVAPDGIVNLAANPGNLLTDIWRTTPGYFYWPTRAILWKQVYGAYTFLWAGLAREVSVADTGRYVIPWGRWHSGQRRDIVRSLRSKEEGGTGRAAEFWDWCEEQTRAFR